MDSAAQAPLANVVTLGVHDPARMRAFYQALGWPVVYDDGDLCVFELRGTVLSLFPAVKLAEDGRSDVDPGAADRRGVRFTLAIMAERREEVDAVVARAELAGARVTKAPEDSTLFDGRSSYFADPENNFWEVAWSPPDNPVTAAALRAARVERSPAK